MTTTVEVRIELGHRAKIRDVPTEEEHTHDWVVFVKGYEKDGENINLEHFVEKVVFWLHESYEQPKRVLRSPPYKVEQSGFAGFNMLIDVHFRNREEPRMVRFEYDLFLHTEAMPPVNHTRLEKLTFTNPTEDFRKKLLSAGAKLTNPVSNSKQSSKERPHQSMSPSKKERSKFKEHSKRRDGSSSRHLDSKKVATVLSGKKDGRIAAKDIKHHEDDFKHPKPPEATGSKSSKESEQSERSRHEKKRSVAGDDGSKKKKKRHSSPQPHQQSRPKSVNVSSSSTSGQIPVKKEKTRKIKEKPDLMAGLFAPENSIKMSQVKQSKEKIKTEPSDMKIKKEKRTNPTSVSSDSPRAGQDDRHMSQYSKVSPSGNLTLKIKKDVISQSSDKNPKQGSVPSNRPEKVKKDKKKSSSDKEKKRKREKIDPSSTKSKKIKEEAPRIESPAVSSSSNLSDMDISSNPDSSPEREIVKTSSSKREHTPKDSKPIKTSSQKKDSLKNIEKPGKQGSSSNNSGSSKLEKQKIEKGTSFKESPTVSRLKEKTKSSSSPHSEKSVSTKPSKSSKDGKRASSSDRNRDESMSHKSRKDKHSTHDKKSSSKESKTKTKSSSVKSERTVTLTPTADHITVKSERTSSPSFHGSISPASSIKSKKSPKPSVDYVKDKRMHKQSSIDKKPSKSSSSSGIKRQSSKATPKAVEEKPQEVFKSRFIIESDSSSDSDDPDIDSKVQHTKPFSPAHELEVQQRVERPRQDSISSQSSLVSSVASRTSDKMQSHGATSSSESSSDEYEISKINSNATATEPAISPIRDSFYSETANPNANTTAYQDMEMSDSSDSEHEHEEDHPPLPPAPQDEHDNIPLSRNPIYENLPKQNIDIDNVDPYSSSDEDAGSPPEKPFQNHQTPPTEQDHQTENTAAEVIPNVLIQTGQSGPYPHMTDSFYRELQDLQKKISYITDVNRLLKIVVIVQKAKKLLQNEEYLDFDLCSLDQRTIRKIQKEVKTM